MAIVTRPSNSFFAFRHHYGYLSAIRLAIEETYALGRNPRSPEAATLVGICEASARSDQFKRLQRSDLVDLAIVKKSLANAWTTELMLSLGASLEAEDIVGPVNNWAVVQAYYSCFQAANALVTATHAGKPSTHEKTQQLFLAHWVNRDAGLPPWSLGSGRAGPLNFGALSLDEGYQGVVCTKDTCWSLIYRALRTTRDDILEKRLKDARRRHKRARLTTRQRQEEEFSTRNVCLLDYLYRLRIRSNYEDTEMFVEGPQSTQQSQTFNQNLRAITSATLMLHEFHIARRIGRESMLELMDSWMKDGFAHRGSLALRRTVLAESHVTV